MKIVVPVDPEHARRAEARREDPDPGAGRNTVARALFRRAYGREPGLIDGDIDDMSFEECFGYTPGDQ